MELKQIKGTSKKTGKEYTAYCVQIGEYRTHLFFPSKVELIYIQSILNKSEDSDFIEM